MYPATPSLSSEDFKRLHISSRAYEQEILRTYNKTFTRRQECQFLKLNISQLNPWSTVLRLPAQNIYANCTVIKKKKHYTALK
jgi:hypothetical protein